MSDFRARLYEEHTQLSMRVEKLEAFILSSGFEDLPDIERRDLKTQLGHMKAYFEVLNMRVGRLCNNN